MSPSQFSPAALQATALARLLGRWDDAGPLHRGLAERIRLLILDGRLPLGVRLPSERGLAEALGLSRTTVAAAYEALRTTGHARSRRGSGTVTELPGPARPASVAPAARGLLDLTRAALPAASLVAGALRSATQDLPLFLGHAGYELRGLPHLRARIADHYTERGLPTDPDEVLVTLGGQHAIHLLASTVIRRGDRALVEAPTYPHAMGALREAGARLVVTPVHSVAPGTQPDGGRPASAAGAGTMPAPRPGVPGPEDGWDAAGLASTLGTARPALAYVMPRHHNPTGSTMSPATRAALLRAAAAGGTLVVADETTAGLSLDGSPPGPALGGEADAGFAGPGGRRRDGAGVAHIGSLGKLFWGGLRIGWIRAERALINRVVAGRPAHDLGTPIVEQLAAAELLDRLPEAVAERAVQLRQASSALARLAPEWLPGWELPPVAGGLASWARLPSPSSSALAIAAREEGLLLPAGPWFGVDGRSFERFVRLPLTLEAAELDTVVPALSRAWARVEQASAASPGGRGQRERGGARPLGVELV